jgi:hypothetical protein
VRARRSSRPPSPSSCAPCATAARWGEPGQRNAEIRLLTSFDREVKYLIRKIKKDGMVEVEGRGGATRWRFAGDP